MTIPAVMSRNAGKKGATCKRQNVCTSPPARRATPVTLSNVLGVADDELPLTPVTHLKMKF